MAKKKYETRRSMTDPRTHRTRKTQIEFKMNCAYCNGEFWGKSRKAKFCSTNCRVLNHVDKKPKKPVLKIPDKEAEFFKKRPQTKLKLKVKPINKTKKKK